MEVESARGDTHHSLLLAGLDTVVNFQSFVMIHLATHPEIVSELGSDHMKLLRGVEEMFRRFPASWLQHIPTFKLREGARPINHSGIIAAIENVPPVWP